LYLHAGESTARSNNELYDAVLLGCKRIGHGFALAKSPNLIKKVIEDNICLEICPVSNHALGYVNDLRTHPARSLLTKGVMISLNPDDQGFWDAPGVTMDYLCAYLAWDLDIADLSKIAENSYKFASIIDKEKDKYIPFFKNRWVRFCQYVN
jgi:adenosine deaminase CECR1